MINGLSVQLISRTTGASLLRGFFAEQLPVIGRGSTVAEVAGIAVVPAEALVARSCSESLP
jgi:hypothetical protein